MIEYLGYVGLVILVASYCFLNTKKTNWFLYLNLIATILLFYHAYNIQDYPQLGVNGFVFIMWSIKLYNGGIK